MPSIPIPNTCGPAYHLGCPVWACENWVGKLYRCKNRRKWLGEYSQVFNTVEGNSTFYGLPSPETVTRWANDSADGFQFVMKFPRSITHDAKLQNTKNETRSFLRILDTLARAERLGPTFLQLPPSFGSSKLRELARYLGQLPRDFRFAVEVRNYDFYDDGDRERQLTDVLTGLGMDWVLLDSRGLFAKPPADETERVAQGRKPRTPFRSTTTAGHPIVRFIGRNDPIEVQQQISDWADIVADWIGSGLQPYVFAHAPDDQFAPEFAVAFHRELRVRLPSLPVLRLPEFPRPEQQKQLF